MSDSPNHNISRPAPVFIGFNPSLSYLSLPQQLGVMAVWLRLLDSHYPLMPLGNFVNVLERFAHGQVTTEEVARVAAYFNNAESKEWRVLASVLTNPMGCLYRCSLLLAKYLDNKEKDWRQRQFYIYMGYLH